MTKAEDGGYAFPANEKCPDGSHYQSHLGLSLRDWFAGQAIGAVIRQCAGDQAVSLDSRTPEQYFADKAFGIADAMLAKREK